MRTLAYGIAGGIFLAATPILAETVVVTPDQVVITEDMRIETQLTDTHGDGWRGVNLYMDEYTANCVACHANPDVAATGLQGDVGPAVDYLGERYDIAQLRAILVNAPAVFGEDTEMPAFYVGEEGETILTAQQIEDIITYLEELRRM